MREPKELKKKPAFTQPEKYADMDFLRADKDPLQWTFDEFQRAVRFAQKEQMKLAARKNKQYGNTYATFGHSYAIEEAIRVAFRLARMVQRYAVEDHAGHFLGLERETLLADAKIWDQLMDLVNYATYAQFFFMLQEASQDAVEEEDESEEEDYGDEEGGPL